MFSALREIKIQTQVFLWFDLSPVTHGWARSFKVGSRLHCDKHGQRFLCKQAVVRAHLRTDSYFLLFWVLFMTYRDMKDLDVVEKEEGMSVWTVIFMIYRLASPLRWCHQDITMMERVHINNEVDSIHLLNTSQCFRHLWQVDVGTADIMYQSPHDERNIEIQVYCDV